MGHWHSWARLRSLFLVDSWITIIICSVCTKSSAWTWNHRKNVFSQIIWLQKIPWNWQIVPKNHFLSFLFQFILCRQKIDNKTEYTSVKQFSPDSEDSTLNWKYLQRGKKSVYSTFLCGHPSHWDLFALNDEKSWLVVLFMANASNSPNMERSDNVFFIKLRRRKNKLRCGMQCLLHIYARLRASNEGFAYCIHFLFIK